MSEEIQRNFVKYTFYKVLPEWKQLSDAHKTSSKKEVIVIFKAMDVFIDSPVLTGRVC